MADSDRHEVPAGAVRLLTSMRNGLLFAIDAVTRQPCGPNSIAVTFVSM